jgi:hypothetical protein
MRKHLLTALALAVLVPGTRAADKDDGWTALFNGRDLTGWKVHFKDADKDADPTKTFTVKEGVMVVTGMPTCYIYSDKSYKNYVITYVWRFPEGSKPESNSGLLVHIQPPHKVMPKCVEPQGRYYDHGKLFALGGTKIEGNKFNLEAHKKALKPMGQWSTTEVTCKADGSITVKLNGIEISSGKADITEGPIGFQSEGFEVHFKNIKIKEMK